MNITNLLIPILAIVFYIVYLLFPILLYKRLVDTRKNIYITIIFFILIIICNDFILNNKWNTIVLFYDYFFWIYPFDLNFTNEQVYKILWSFFIPLFVEYILILYYTNKKYLLYYFVIHFFLLFLSVSYFLYQIIADRPWFLSL